MPRSNPERPHLTAHPLIAKLSESKEPHSVVRFAGYIGDSDRAGHLRLYLALRDLSQYVELEHGAIVATEEAPESALPDHGSFVWVRSNSPARAVRLQMYEGEARNIAAAIGSGRMRARY